MVGWWKVVHSLCLVHSVITHVSIIVFFAELFTLYLMRNG